VATPASSGGCTVKEDLQGCQVGSHTFDVSGEVTWNSAYTSATGTESIRVDGACSGSYAVSISEP